jgi:hypothetical protein
MEGKRFGVGLAAGLLVALAVVTIAGGLGTTPVSVLLAPKGIVGGTSASPTTTATLYATATTVLSSGSTSISSATSGASIPQTVSGNETFGVTSTVSGTTASKSSSTAPSLSNAVGTPSSTATGPSYSSRVDSIANQPLLSNAVILVPVLIAFLLGAFLYRVSTRSRGEPSS